MAGAPIRDFPIGTKIKILRETNGWGSVNVGDIGIITDSRIATTSIEFDTTSCWG